LSLVLAAFSHLTVGQQTCELVKSANTDSSATSALPGTDEACRGFLERWVDSLAAGPVPMPYYWILSLLGGLAAAGTIYYRDS
jgi:hypothetical protein